MSCSQVQSESTDTSHKTTVVFDFTCASISTLKRTFTIFVFIFRHKVSDILLLQKGIRIERDNNNYKNSLLKASDGSSRNTIVPVNERSASLNEKYIPVS